MKKKITAFLMACVCCHCTLYADDSPQSTMLPSYTGDELVVTATRFPVREKESSRFVTVADSEKLKEVGATNAMDALGKIGGLGYKSLAPMGINRQGMNAAVYIRGIEDGELILINGMPVQQASSKGYDISSIPVEQIERIEVLKGAASTLYGADAMAGVINIVTKKAVDEKSGTASVEFGNEEWMNHGVSISLPGISAGVRYQHMGELDDVGRDLKNEHSMALGNTDKYMVNVNASPFDNVSVDYQYNWYETTFIDRYDSGEEESTDQESSFHFLNLRYETARFKAKAFGVYDNRYQTDYVNEEQDGETLQRLNYNYGAETDYRVEFSEAFELVAGADYVHRFADYENNYGEKHREDYGLFAELKAEPSPDLLLTLGVREQFIDNEDGTSDYDAFLPSAGVTWKVNEELNLFANTGKAFQAPTFTQLYYEGRIIVGNPDLEPDSGWTYEAGFKYDSGVASARLAGFYMTYDDKIEVDRSQGRPYGYFNAGSYSSKGVEWKLGLYPFLSSGSFLSDVSFSAAGYWAYPVAENTDGEEYQPGPKFQNTFGISYATQPVNLDLTCRILAGREDELENYAAFDMTGKVKAGSGYVTLAVENVFDTEIQTTGNLVEDASSRYVYYEPGRLARLGYTVSF
ncbi:TonB-dependent receptor [Prosthecochloris sp. N3]|uniref:TonB-dependent receptor n=1 Tax=Prosthecochloris ethylica TaxID=2743976 RepID=A0ABR9XSF7_9CHLB|nr:TonB-dependent receptor [Prosthecochloris ethylica]MBF0585347.1 TonB-dependent receptor [Prosthecochloris ethylica]MBF0636883.1 TonB-dependent receptor [Prosthecochloris ethylica]NUK46576.1 TonB-dependent receptor [Prosthecochloris ethylica]